MHSLLAGFTLSLTLIVAIGAQNAYVLKQGLKAHRLQHYQAVTVPSLRISVAPA